MAASRIDAPVKDATPVHAGHGIMRLVNRVRVELIDALDRELAPFDISAPQLFVLSSVANKEADSAAGLCKSISYDPGAMTRMIDRLQQKGLVRRVPRPEDRRAMNLELTVAGRALFPQLVAAKDRVQTQFLRGFSKEEASVLQSFLQRMLANR
jgi:DNA-binding MarR family transcriptional regulator